MRSRHPIRHAAIAGLAFAAANSIMAYPIPPAPLWRLVHDAEAIIVAQVLSVEDPPPVEAPPDESDDWVEPPGSTARLHVTERWKGEIDVDVAVPFEPNMVCPAPPRYEPGSTVLAFLARNDDGVWYTVHLSYGTLYPLPEDLPIYHARVREALALQAKKGLERAERIEWLVRCAENHPMRWHGIYELAGVSRRFDSDEDGLRIPPAELLTDEHRQRIARGFVREPKLESTIASMLEVLGSYRDERLDKALVAAVDRALEADEPDTWVLRASIPAILSRLGDTSGDSRLPERSEALEGKPEVEAIRKAWRSAKAALVSHE